MQSKRPRFSIILPTYNRAHLLPLAIRSVLEQTFDDFELIISNGGSTDNTETVIEGFRDPRIKYYASTKRLSMGDNYEFALAQATGEFIVFFSDDDAFITSGLAKLNDLFESSGTEMIVFRYAQYIHPYLFRNKRIGNALLVDEFTSSHKMVPSNTALVRQLIISGLSANAYEYSIQYPLIGNVAFHKRLVDSLKTKVTRFFGLIPVDTYFATLLLSTIENYLSLDLPLLVWSRWEGNSSGVLSKGKSLQKHYLNLLGETKLTQVPFSFPLPLNLNANAVMTVISQLDLKRDDIRPNWHVFYERILDELVYLGSEGVDVENEFDEFIAVAESRSEFEHFATKARKMKKLANVKRELKTFLDKIGFRKSIYVSGSTDKTKKIDGSNSGFNNFLEASKYLGKLIND